MLTNWVTNRVERELLVLATGPEDTAAIQRMFKFRRKLGEESERLLEFRTQLRGHFLA